MGPSLDPYPGIAASERDKDVLRDASVPNPPAMLPKKKSPLGNNNPGHDRVSEPPMFLFTMPRDNGLIAALRNDTLSAPPVRLRRELFVPPTPWQPHMSTHLKTCLTRVTRSRHGTRLPARPEKKKKRRGATTTEQFSTVTRRRCPAGIQRPQCHDTSIQSRTSR